MPLASIIIPCYNGSRYLPQLTASLKPILAAYPGRYEIIFVDDGSQDNSAELMRELLPEAIIIRQPNRGLSAARNAGIAHAQGEFLQLLDADDTIEPNKLEIQAAAAQAESADVVYSDWRLLTVNGANISTETFAPAHAPNEMIEALLTDWYVPPVGYLFRRSTYLEIGGCDENIKVWEDFDLFLRLALAGKKHCYAPGILSNYYRFLEIKSLARRDPTAGARSREKIILKTVATLEKTSQLTQPRSKAAARSLFGVMRTAGINDPTWLRQIAAKIYELDPGFKPSGSGSYKILATLFGLVLAERIAQKLRSQKA